MLLSLCYLRIINKIKRIFRTSADTNHREKGDNICGFNISAVYLASCLYLFYTILDCRFVQYMDTTPQDRPEADNHVLVRLDAFGRAKEKVPVTTYFRKLIASSTISTCSSMRGDTVLPAVAHR